MPDISNDVRFEVLHDYLKAKRADAEKNRARALEDGDKSRARASEREINVADLWLNDLFDAFVAHVETETTESQAKLERWRRAVGA